MTISRKEAITLASFIKMIHLSEEKRDELINEALAEISTNPASEVNKNEILRSYIQDFFFFYTNDYISFFLKREQNIAIEVNGEEPVLYPCSCCNFKTLEVNGEYSICKVCFWEDDGTTDETKISSVNHMTLKEAKSNFKLLGALSESAVKFLDSDRFIQFRKIEQIGSVHNVS